MNKLIRLLSFSDLLYRLATKIVATRIVWSDNLLTPEHLIAKGWIVDENGFWIEPNMKVRDKIWIKFEHHYFRIWHGEERVFIALESRVEWFELYYLFVCDRDRRYELAGI